MPLAYYALCCSCTAIPVFNVAPDYLVQITSFGVLLNGPLDVELVTPNLLTQFASA